MADFKNALPTKIEIIKVKRPIFYKSIKTRTSLLNGQQLTEKFLIDNTSFPTKKPFI